MQHTPRQLTDHQVSDFNTDRIGITVLDEPDHEKGGGAHHKYAIHMIPVDPAHQNDIDTAVISFQHGPVKEFGVNGVSNEALIAIVLDRLRSFQRGKFSCRENALQITNLEIALMWSHKRTLDRVRRGVEGLNKE